MHCRRVRGVGRVRRRVQLPLLELPCADRLRIPALGRDRAREAEGDQGCGFVGGGRRGRRTPRDALPGVRLAALLDCARRHICPCSVRVTRSTSRRSSRRRTCSSARRLRGTRSSTTFHSTTSTPGPDLATSSARREPADQPSEQQPGLRRQGNVGRHADDDPERHADRCTQDDGPDVSAITGCSARHRRLDPRPAGLPGQSMSTPKRAGRSRTAFHRLEAGALP